MGKVVLDVETKVDTKDAEGGIGKLNSLMEKLIKVQEEAIQESKGLNKAVQNVGDSAKKTEKGVSALSKGFKGVGLAIKAAGIGLLLSALGSLQEVFMSNQRVANGFSTAMEGISIVFNDFVNFVVNNVGAVTGVFSDIFEDPIGSMQSFGMAIKNNIQERILSLIDAIGFLGEAISNVFKGEWDAAIESAKNAGKEFVDVATGIDDSFDKTVQFAKDASDAISDYAVNTFNAAKANVQLANDSRLAQAQQQGLIEKYDRLAEQQRQIRDNDQLSFKERIAANEALGLLLEKQGEEERKLAQIRLDAANAQLAKDKENIDSLVAVQEAKNELAAIDARIEGFRSEQLINRNALEREQAQETADEIKQIFDELDKERKDAADSAKKIEEDKNAAFTDITKQGFAAASQIAGESVQAQKGIAATQATFDTYSAIAGSLAQYSGPGAPPIPGFAIAQAIATGAFGFLQVSKILSTNSPQTSGGGAGSFSAGSAAVPQGQQGTLPNIGFTDESQLGDNQEAFRPARAYVIQQDIKSQSSLAQTIDDRQRI